jgi:uncharacterized membrane-anchored protein YitT (DUF2179 family)
MQKTKKETINIIIFILGIFLIALTFNIFCVSNNYITGGLSGVSIVFKYLLNIKVSTTLLIGNILLVIIGTIVLGIKKIIPSVVGSIIYTTVVYITENINTILNIHMESPFLNIITIGILFGIGYTMVYIAGFTTGGSDILGLIFKEKFGLPLGKSLLIINSIILILGTITFGFEMLVIALLCRYIESKVIDSLLTGISDSKVMFINTKNIKEINEYIINTIKSGTSEITVTSGYKKEKTKIIMCVVPTEKYIKLKEKIKKIDPHAFITIVDAYEVYGGTNRYKLPFHDLRL